MTQEQATEEKINKIRDFCTSNDSITKIRNFCTSDDNVTKIKRQCAECENYLQTMYLITFSSLQKNKK